MNRYRRLLAAVAALATLAGARTVAAGSPTEQLKVEVDRVITTLADPALKVDGKTAERRGRVRAIANDIFDWNETAKRSLARHWQPLTEAQRAEFVQLFGDLLERAYISKIDLYSGEKVTYAGEVVEGDQALVKTKVATKQGNEVPIDYRMLRRGDQWLVYDVVIEGVSLVGNYRTQFNKLIQTSSYSDVVAKMRAKLTEPEYAGSDGSKRPPRAGR
jgi:phospholipid transport system substrate-binding protein